MSENKQILLEAYRDLKRKVSGESSKSLREALKKYGDTVSFKYKYCPDLDKDPLAINAARAVVSAEHQDRSVGRILFFQIIQSLNHYPSTGILTLFKDLIQYDYLSLLYFSFIKSNKTFCLSNGK